MESASKQTFCKIIVTAGMDKNVVSPITGKDNVLLERTIKVKEIVEGYQKTFGMDVSKYFGDLDQVSVYKCLDTSYRFYYPFDIAGDGEFYDQLQKFEWYYQDWKWEYEVAFELLKGSKSLLEIGCGKGAFLKRMQENGTACVGLELSNEATVSGRTEGLDIINQPLSSFSDFSTAYSFDAVCSFQLLEHVNAVSDMISDSLKVLKKGGRLFIAVPNNDLLYFKYGKKKIKSLDYFYQPAKLLNSPPHHMGLWDENALLRLADIFKLSVESIIKEPINNYREKLTAQILNEKLSLLGFLNSNFSYHKQICFLKKMYPKNFLYGDSIIGVFRKDAD